ncbi:MAG TPA: DNA translocase FtsK 4TM domain-containing protein, partial [Vicinamibacteria bacterium]|nr:DNA translocase FtsK 4TM domain-containing protein [Vicinamibacteria bacterium]
MAPAAASNRKAAEFLGLVSFALSLMVLISVATYDPADPVPFFKAGATGPVRNFIGPMGAFLAELLIPQLFGVAALLVPLVLGITGWKLFWCRPIEAPYTKAAGLSLLLVSLTALLNLLFAVVTIEGETVRAGGAVGQIAASMLTASFNRTGAYIVVATSLFVSLILATQFSFATFLSGLGRFLAARTQAMRAAWARLLEARRKEKMRRDVIKKHTQREKEAPESESVPRVRKVKATPDGPPEGGRAAQKPLSFTPSPDTFRAAEEPGDEEEADDLAIAPAMTPPPRARGGGGSLVVRGNFPLPPTSIMDEIKVDLPMDKTRLFEKAKTLQGKSGEFGVLGSVVEIHPGPVVTTYEFKPDAGVKYSKIVGLADDLALALEAESIRIDRISGRGTVGIEIPNEVRETIYLREILEGEAFGKSSARLTLALGKTVSGDTYVTDLAAMPHLLIAGSTGTGKSVGLNCMIASILYKSTPDEVRMILIDPKRLELGVYEDIPHLLTPVVTDPKIAANVLKWAVGEMEKRIRKLASEGVRNIEQSNNV